MEDKQARIRIKNKAIEIEIEGSEGFVENQNKATGIIFSYYYIKYARKIR